MREIKEKVSLYVSKRLLTVTPDYMVSYAGRLMDGSDVITLPLEEWLTLSPGWQERLCRHEYSRGTIWPQIRYALSAVVDEDATIIKEEPRDEVSLSAVVLRAILIGGNNVDLSSVSLDYINNLNCLFRRSTFNGDVSKWNTKYIKSMFYTFAYSEFNGDVSGWDTGMVSDVRGLFLESKFRGSIANWRLPHNVITDHMMGGVAYKGGLPQIEQNNN